MSIPAGLFRKMAMVATKIDFVDDQLCLLVTICNLRFVSITYM